VNTKSSTRRLDELARTIMRLDEAAVDAEREAVDLQGDELACSMLAERALSAKTDLDRALRAYFLESEVVRRGELRRVA
jgi:hypothetical protein